MYLFYSASRLATTSPTNLSQADVVLPFVNTFSTDLSRASNNIDIDGDQIDDLVFSNAQATSSSGNASAGRLYVVRGAYTKTQLPTSGVTDLENFSVPGSGSYLVDRSTGRPQLFNNAGAPFTIATGQVQWYRFTTMGDGKVGDVIRLIDQTNATAWIQKPYWWRCGRLDQCFWRDSGSQPVCL